MGVLVSTSEYLRCGHLLAVFSSIEPKSADFTRDLRSSATILISQQALHSFM